MGGVVWLVMMGMLVVLWVPPAAPCVCSHRHPQQHVCESDFVVFARVRRVTQTPDGLTAYKVKIKRILKGSEKVELMMQKGLIYTLPDTCQMKLERKTSQIITGEIQGGKPWTNLCHFAMPWRDMSSKMKKGFRLLYQRGCDCPIMSCHYWERDCVKASFLCSWETSLNDDDCQKRHAVCLRGADGSCNWLGGRLYRECMKPLKNRNNDIIPITNHDDNEIIKESTFTHDNNNNNNNKIDSNEISPNSVDRNENLIPIRRRPYLGYKRRKGFGNGPKKLRRPYPNKVHSRRIGYIPKQG